MVVSKLVDKYMDQVDVCNIKDYVMPALAETNPANDYGAYKGSANNAVMLLKT